MRRPGLVVLSVCCALVLGAVAVLAQGPKPQGASTALGTAFTYQGQLKRGGAPVMGSCNLSFKLYADAGGTSLVAGPVNGSPNSVSVNGGLFTVQVDFGANAYTGDARWLQTIVQCTGDSSPTALSLQALAPEPMALALPGLWAKANATSPNLIGGYSGNVISDTVVGSTIGGGGSGALLNRIGADYATIGGGYANTANGNASVIGGGNANLANSGDGVIGGGLGNTIAVNGAASAISGGAFNAVSGQHAIVGGGNNNVASGDGSVIDGGTGNTVSGSGGVIGGGLNNIASGTDAVVTGGFSNTASADFSLAAGRKAWARNSGSFVWNDSVDSGTPFADSQANQFNVRASGGVRFYTSDDYSTYCVIAPGGGSWNCTSDRNAKANFASVDGRAVLAQLASIPIETWNFKSEDAAIRHIGPMAQDFHEAFGVGEDDATIGTVDAQGVALAAIQGLNQLVQEQHEEIVTLKAQVAVLQEHSASAGLSSPAASRLSAEWMAIAGLVLMNLGLGSAFAWHLRQGGAR